MVAEWRGVQLSGGPETRNVGSVGKGEEIEAIASGAEVSRSRTENSKSLTESIMIESEFAPRVDKWSIDVPSPGFVAA